MFGGGAMGWGGTPGGVMCAGAKGTWTGMMAPAGMPSGTTTWNGYPAGVVTTIWRRPGIKPIGTCT